jgi:hypothetical protein
MGGKDGIMGEHDTFTALDEVEQSNLQRMISSVETALAASTPDIRSVLEKVLHNAKGRVEVLEKKFKDFQAERENRSRENAAIAALVERETALSDEEREEYAEFLTKDFFTKRDFSALEQFYAHTWDRLSEGGKDEMSHRVWEGIRKHEYTFAELPDPVKEKEAERILRRLGDSREQAGRYSGIPEQDRKDFLEATAKNDIEAVYSVLGRESFTRNIGKKDGPRIEHFSATDGRDSDAGKVAQTKSEEIPEQKSTSPRSGDIDFSSVNLSGLQLSQSESKQEISRSGSTRIPGR